VISTHILDLSRGRPAAGVAVSRERLDDRGAGTAAGRGVSDADGRVRELAPADAPLGAGRYRITFETGAYFDALGVEAFYPVVTVVFTLREPAQHHHVPLLLSPFGYSPYRGS
jgi:5-hydroxyisourate hydrolase